MGRLIATLPAIWVVKSINIVPNCISIVRVVAAACLLIVKPFSVQFMIIYMICGLSDVMDGYIARKMNASSKFGQILDSVADVVFVSIVLVVCIPVINLEPWTIGWIVLIAVIRLLSLCIGFVRYRHLALLHTYANKGAGIALFCFPLLYLAVGKDAASISVCCIAMLSAIEELLINITAKTLNRDRKSILIHIENSAEDGGAR